MQENGFSLLWRQFSQRFPRGFDFKMPRSFESRFGFLATIAACMFCRSGYPDLFRDLFFLGFDGADDSAEGGFLMLLGAFRKRSRHEKLFLSQ
jgi:hypothetical protein